MNVRPEIYVACTLLAVVGGIYAGLPEASRGPGLGTIMASPPPDNYEGPRLVVFETKTCGWCIRFRNDLAPAYARSPHQERAPLVYVQLSRQALKAYKLKADVHATPTFVLVSADDREIGRITGYPGRNERLYALLDKHVQ